MTGLRELVEAVREARAAVAGPRCDHSKDACLRCDRCRLHASVTRPVLRAMVASVKLSEYLLSTPDVLAAVEAVRALGEAREKSAGLGPREHFEAWCTAGGERVDAQRTIEELADRLAKGGE